MQRKLKQPSLIAMWLIATGLAFAQHTSVAVADADKTQSVEHRLPACAMRRGCLIRSDALGGATRDQVAQGLAAIGWSNVAVKSGVTFARLVYSTIDAHGEPTIASGLLALPSDVEPVGIVSFGHGTDSLRSYVPSAPTFEGLGGRQSLRVRRLCVGRTRLRRARTHAGAPSLFARCHRGERVARLAHGRTKDRPHFRSQTPTIPLHHGVFAGRPGSPGARSHGRGRSGFAVESFGGCADRRPI